MPYAKARGEPEPARARAMSGAARSRGGRGWRRWCGRAARACRRRVARPVGMTTSRGASDPAPPRYRRGGDRHPGIGPDATPAHMPDRHREPRGPDPFRAPDYPAAIRHGILSGRGTQAQDLLPQFMRQRGQRQQAGKRRRAHRTPAATGTGPAFPDVPDDQVARLFGQLPVPVGQQLPQHRAGLTSGKRDVQRTEGFLQPALGARSQVVCPAL